MNTQIVESNFLVYDDAGIDQAVENASGIFEVFKRLTVDNRILFLANIAAEINSVKQDLVHTAQKETSLPIGRLNGEIDRTISQINMFVTLLKDGSWVNAIIDTALPDRSPMPKPDIRQMQQPLGVVCVFGAGNFPFAFSVAGGDTIAAIAAGCPVLFKVHNGHPQTSFAVGECISRAADKTAIPPGVFTLLLLDSLDSAIRLVTHPLVKVVAFTGSFTGGKAIFDAAVRRTEPIPVFAEMGSVNPVFILPGKLKECGDDIAKTLVFSNTLGVGQFCTNPGLMIMINSALANEFNTSFQKYLCDSPGETMLSDMVYENYCKSINNYCVHPHLSVLAQGRKRDLFNEAVPHSFKISGKEFLKHNELSQECFGPSSIHVLADSDEQLFDIAGNLPGQLTVSVWASEQDFTQYDQLFKILENKAGRIIINNAPTGVEVSHAMVHGGPYPATTDSRSTSVGSQSIYRFTRPVCYQNFPQQLLPPELKDNNPLFIRRKVNGEFENKKIKWHPSL